MLVYGSSMSPFVRKVLAYCAEKGIAVESQAVGIGSTDEGFRAASPLGKMPALVDGDFNLSDSSAIIHYLEAKFPEPALIPALPEDRGRVIWFEEFGDTILSGCIGKMFFNWVVSPVFLKREGNEAVAEQTEKEELPPILDYLERELDGCDFLVGESVTLADVAVAASLANLEHVGVRISAEKWPNVSRFERAMLARPSLAPLIERERAYFRRIGR